MEIGEPKKLIDRLSGTVQVSFFTDVKLDKNFFAGIPEIKKISAGYPKVILEISSLDKISEIINLLKRQNTAFYGFTAKTASLEDIYLSLTGKEFDNE